MAARQTKHYIAYVLFTATVVVLLLLNWLGVFKTVFGVDTAILLALFGGYKIYYNAISALFEKRISADLAIVLAIGAALAIGENVAAAEAIFIMLIGEGLEAMEEILPRIKKVIVDSSGSKNLIDLGIIRPSQ